MVQVSMPLFDHHQMAGIGQAIDLSGFRMSARQRESFMRDIHQSAITKIVASELADDSEHEKNDRTPLAEGQ